MADSPFIVDVTADNFEEVMQTSFKVPVLVDFWASWCQPCLVLMPILARLAEEYDGRFVLGKVNTEADQALAARFGIRGIPNVKLFRDGKQVDEFTGALPEPAVREFLDRHVARESDTQVAEARERLAEGDAKAAIALLSGARNADPDNPRIAIALAEAQAAAGDVEAAESTIKSLPANEQVTPEVETLKNRLFFEAKVVDAPGGEELEDRLASDPEDLEAAFELALRKVTEEDYDRAMALLLGVMEKDRGFGDDAGRRGLVKVFDLLGDDPRVSDYRRRMAQLLY